MRPMIETDLRGIYELHNDAETQKFTWIDGLQTPDEILQWILTSRLLKAEDLSFFSIIDKNNAEFLGLCGFRERKDFNNNIDIAYRIHPQNRLKGIASECTAALIEWGKTSKGIKHIISQVHAENTISQRIMHKLCFQMVDNRGIWWLYELNC